MRKRTFVLVKRIIIRLLVLVIIVGIFYLYFRTDIFTIHNYQLVGVPENEMGELKVQIQILSDQKVFYFLPGNRIISYNRAKIKDLIFKKFSNTAEIKIYPYGLDRVKIVVTTYEHLF